MLSMFVKAMLVSILLVTASSCGGAAPQVVDSPPKAQNPPAPEKVECIGVCYVDEEDQCVTTGSIVDGSVVEEKKIPCPSSCCDEYRRLHSASRDPDGDGMVDDQDGCPEDAEDFDEFADEDGCPDPDNDGDGILDADDVCPLDAEDIDGFQDDDGCAD
jgi:hypothetical protein